MDLGGFCCLFCRLGKQPFQHRRPNVDASCLYVGPILPACTVSILENQQRIRAIYPNSCPCAIGKNIYQFSVHFAHFLSDSRLLSIAPSYLFWLWSIISCWYAALYIPKGTLAPYRPQAIKLWTSTIAVTPVSVTPTSRV